MKLENVAAVALAVLIATAGVAAAAPWNLPSDPGADSSERKMNNDARDTEGASQAHDGYHSENAFAVNGDVSAANPQGSGEALPEQVPDHVAQIHDLIRQFLDGELGGSLGEAINGVAGSDDAASEPDATG